MRHAGRTCHASRAHYSRHHFASGCRTHAASTPRHLGRVKGPHGQCTGTACEVRVRRTTWSRKSRRMATGRLPHMVSRLSVFGFRIFGFRIFWAFGFGLSAFGLRLSAFGLPHMVQAVDDCPSFSRDLDLTAARKTTGPRNQSCILCFGQMAGGKRRSPPPARRKGLL